MSSRCPDLLPRRLALAVLALTLVTTGCEREQRRFSEPGGSAVTLTTPLSDIRAGGPAVANPVRSPYDENAFAISEGQRLFEWFNCTGCHAHGGGSMGPALMDAQWVYGSAPEQIFSTIVQGRPNGMPAFGGRIPTQQVWQLVAYVRSLSGELPKAASPSRPDSMFMRKPPAETEPVPAPTRP
jgi:cytochrome c oxidase cbb3-type subunit III